MHPKQPLWILEKTTRLLTLLAGRPAIFRQLMSFPDGYAAAAGTAVDYTKIPHIERLCAFLVDDVNHQGPEVRVLRFA